MDFHFYTEKENLRGVLRHFLAISSEGREPVVPIVRNHSASGEVDVQATLALPAFAEFPQAEKKLWLVSNGFSYAEVVEPEAEATVPEEK